MYLTSKINPKHIGILILLISLLIISSSFPFFRKTVKEMFLFFSNQIIGVRKYPERIKRLEEENLTLFLKLREYRYLKEENEHLRQILKFKEKKELDLIGTEIISFDPSSWRRVVIVNVGKNQGVRKGLLAIDESANLVGRIEEVKDNYSSMVLINDPEFYLPVMVGKEYFGLLKGGLGGVKILYIEREAKIKKNDKVWVNLPFLFYPIYIGEIKSLKQDRNSLFWNIEVKPLSGNPFTHKIFIINYKDSER